MHHLIERVESAQLLVNLSTLDGVATFLVEDLNGEVIVVIAAHNDCKTVHTSSRIPAIPLVICSVEV